jgi:precorrin-6B methylase 2
LPDHSRVEVGGHTIFVDLLDPRFLQVIHEVRSPDTDLQVLSRLLSEGDTFIDVGANHGSFSVVASSVIGAEGHVIAVEP